MGSEPPRILTLLLGYIVANRLAFSWPSTKRAVAALPAPPFEAGGSRFRRQDGCLHGSGLIPSANSC